MAEPPAYPLATGFRSVARLNLQHYLWKQQQGYLIHPAISCMQEKSLKIADVGTGTGIWLLDLSEQLPSTVQLDGFDIDVSQCPPRAWLPSNVAMRKLDIHDEIPKELVGVYDIINIRFFLCVVKDRDPTPIIKKSLQMLKPKGWIQWTEQDLSTCKVVSAFTDADTKYTEQLKSFAIAPTPDWPVNHGSWVASMSETFRHAGLKYIVEDRNEKHSWNLSSSHDITLLAMEEVSLKLGNASGVHEMIQKAALEFENNQRGVALASDRVTVVGMKAGG
ncbi:hypothetical protein JMJ35_009884 [Cladonia borealis]|uniref:Methyltransferase n=1 Tax=Cladonia borealis TaxID=184061 RepID=A0AA39QTX2_9LECA|nr:hypothetical protein JMJ35_009884 [Cladonia borealis]